MTTSARRGGVSLSHDGRGSDPHPAADGRRPPPFRGRREHQPSLFDSGSEAAKPSVAVIIPTFNEADSIGAVVAGLSREIDRVIVVDGGSSDGTRERAKEAGAEVIAVGRGYGLACLTGAQAAADADILVYMDGDGADDPAAVATLIAPIEAGTCDFVIASRARGKREPGSMSWHQLLAGRAIGALIGLFYGARYTDMCALRAIRRDTLFALGMREMTYGWNLEMQMRAARAHLRVREVPVDYRCRIGGQSKVAGSLSGSLKAGAKILTTFARIALEPRSSFRSAAERRIRNP